MTKNGIDVSKWQDNVDWVKVRGSNKVQFAILRAGYGSSTKDPKFETYYKGCKANDIPVGAYWYNYATTIDGARTEAKACINALKGKQFEYPIYYDIEEKATLNKGKGTVSAIAKAFCEELEKAGYFVGVYSMKSGLESYLTDDLKEHYTVWVAHVNVLKTTYKGSFDMWQYSWKGSVPGISGDVDLDYCYKDFPSIIKNAGLNGFVKTSGDSAKANEGVDAPKSDSSSTPNFAKKLYNVKVICTSLNVRTGPGINYPAKEVVRQNEIYSIVEEKNGFGKLISGAGWISISSKYVKKL